MKFITKSQYHQESECGHYMISMSFVGKNAVFTLTNNGVMIAQERCLNSVFDRKEAMQILREAAHEHANA